MSKEMYDACDRIEKYLRDNRIYCDVYPYGDDMPVVNVEIRWGDWKHEHLRAKWLMGEVGAVYVNTVETEENGTDCYSAVHRFIVGNDILREVA